MRGVKPRAWADDELCLLRTMVSDGASSAEIAKELGRYVTSIKRMARKLGLLLRK